MLTLNCDMGESFGSWKMGLDEEVMPFVDMANIACGFHASDPQTMVKTIRLAIEHQVTIGAHPGYPDLLGFGRKAMSFTSEELINLVLYQVGALSALCQANQTKVAYIKPHGALYNIMMADNEVMDAMMQAVACLESDIPLMIMANAERGAHENRAKKYKIRLLFEAFADRAYTDAGQLAPRSQAGAVHSSIEAILAQVDALINHNRVETISGHHLAIQPDTLCVHGDNEFALQAVKAIRTRLQSL